ncbi:MAG: AI-2E family transporter [Gammaproteobacteria bacterium]|nr:AI-2E family transporter [Gammaproteobacteria bacterium]
MSVKGFFSKWYNRHLANPEAIALLLFMAVIGLILYSLGSILLPLIIALVMAYLLEWPVGWFTEYKIPRLLSVLIVFTVFIGMVVLIVVGVVPVLKQQLSSLLNSLPDMFTEGKKLLKAIQQEYPSIFNDNQLVEIVDSIKTFGTTAGRYILSFSIASISNILTIIVYLILVPILVFLLLKDKDILINQADYFMPEESSLIYKVMEEVHIGMGNYIRGKFLEAFIVGFFTYLVLVYYNLQYNALLSVLVGLSVFFPYVGAIISTVPIALVGLFQMGLGYYFIELMTVYTIIQIIDGYILVPVLLSDALRMNSIVIILSIILFGGLFGFWGVVFAIPIAILIKAIINLWPSQSHYAS